MNILVVNDTSTSANQGCQATMHMFNRCLANTFPGSQVKRILLTTTNYPFPEPPSTVNKPSTSSITRLKRSIRGIIRPAVQTSPIEYFLPSSQTSVKDALHSILTTDFSLMVELREKIQWADLVIINGEGSVLEYQRNARFIFMVCELSDYYQKPCHLINFTAHLTRSEAIELASNAFKKCASVAVREPISYYVVKSFFSDVKLFPDLVAGLDIESTNQSSKKDSYVMIGGGSATISLEKNPSAMETLKYRMKQLVQNLSKENISVKLIGWRKDEWLQDIQQDNALFEMTDFVHYYNTCKQAIVNFTGRHHGCVMSFAAGCPFVTTTANCFKNYGDRLLYSSPFEVFEMENFDSDRALKTLLNAAEQSTNLRSQVSQRKKEIEPFIFGAFQNIKSNYPDLVEAGIIAQKQNSHDFQYVQNMKL